MLDKKSERVLKFIVSKYNGNIDNKIEVFAERFNIHYSELNSLCFNLHELGYISSFYYASESTSVDVFLTYKGLKYFENKKSKKLNSLKSSIIIPIIVTILTQLIIFSLEYLLSRI